MKTSATRRALLAALLYGPAVLGPIKAQASAILHILGKPATVLPSPQGLLRPSVLWGVAGGAWGSGFDPTGVSAFPEPTASAPRTQATTTTMPSGNARPSIGAMFPDLQTFDRNAVLGVIAGFEGAFGDPQGLDHVVVHYEGTRTQIFAQSDNTIVDDWGATWVNHMYHAITDCAAHLAMAPNGFAKFYFEAVAKDPATDSQIIGPYRNAHRAGLLAAPWGGPAIYDKIVAVDNTLMTASGSTYTTIPEGVQALRTAGSVCGLAYCVNNGAHLMWKNAATDPGTSNYQITGGVALATQLTTIMTDPRTVNTGAWIDNKKTTASAPGMKQDGQLYRRFNIDISLFGVGFAALGTGFNTNDGTLYFQSSRLYAGVGDPADTNWNGVAGAGLLYKGQLQQNHYLTNTIGHFGWFECDVSNMTYGMTNGKLSGIARNTVGNLNFKFHNVLQWSYNCTIYNTGTYASPNAVPINTFSGYNDGSVASTYSVEKGGGTGNAGTLAYYANTNTFTASASAGSSTLTVTATALGASMDGRIISKTGLTVGTKLTALSVNPDGSGAYTMSLATTGAAVTAPTGGLSGSGWLYDSSHIAILPISTGAGGTAGTVDELNTYLQTLTGLGLHFTQLATTRAQKRSPACLWIGTQFVTPYGQAIPIQAMSNISGSPTIFATIIDAHSDAWSAFGAGNVLNNYIAIKFKAYGKKAGQTFFLDRSASYADFYLDGEFSDDTPTVAPGSVSFATTIAGQCANVVYKQISIVGLGDALSFGPTFAGDKYTKIDATVMDGGLSVNAGADLSLMQIAGVFSRTGTIPSQGDSDCKAMGSPAVATIFANPYGTTPYGYGGAGVPPDLTPANSSVLKMATSGKTCGSRDTGGNWQIAA